MLACEPIQCLPYVIISTFDIFRQYFFSAFSCLISHVKNLIVGSAEKTYCFSLIKLHTGGSFLKGN